jgi:5-methyltetrahydrofolate--homocysteine methyltransferase
MNRFRELLAIGEIILLDGAMGTLLMDSGLAQGDPPEEWNVLQPKRIQEVHKAYIDAGSRIVLTNTFGGSRYRLKLHGLQDRVAELNRAAAVNARIVADRTTELVAVAGSMGPTGELLEPMGTLTFEEAREAFAEQAAALTDGGVDVLWIETMSDLDEVKAAVAGAQSASNLPIVATMSFDTRGYTMMGVSPAKALESLGGLDLIAVGGNCGSTLAETGAALEAMRSLDMDALLIAKPNAGIPRWIDNDLVYDGTPEIMADFARRMRDLGVQLIGSCCGSTPDHTRAMRAALNGS